MKLRDLMGYSSQRGTMAATNFGQMLMNRMRRWVKDDKDTLMRLYSCEFISEYDWLNDRVRVAVRHGGETIFILDDPDDYDQINALAVALRMMDDDDGSTLSGHTVGPRR